MRKAAIFALVFLVAGVVGVALAWRWPGVNPDAPGPGLAADGEGAAEPLPVPNAVYENVEPLLSTPTLDIAAERLNLDDGKADIGGYAPGALHAYLYLNNQEIAYAPVENQGFFFPGVPLEYGVNVIEVKVSDNAGNEMNSMAGIVERMSQRAAQVRPGRGWNRMRGPRELAQIALTIDAGASSRRADQVLDVLRDKGIITTFFLTGQFIERYPELVLRLVEDGHEIGNHTYSHPHLTTFELNRRHNTAAGITRERLQEELLRTKELFESLTGETMAPWWRAPYGEHNEEIREWAEEVGFQHVDWTRTPVNHDLLDWVADEDSRYYLDGDALLQRLLDLAAPEHGADNGGIILMHLGSDRKKDFVDQVLPAAVDELRSRGYRFVTISTMFAR